MIREVYNPKPVRLYRVTVETREGRMYYTPFGTWALAKEMGMELMLQDARRRAILKHAKLENDDGRVENP